MSPERWFPLGFPWRQERLLIRCGLAFASAGGFILFLCQLSPELRRLYWYHRDGTRVLLADACMPPFSLLLHGVWIGFALLAFCLVAAAGYHILWHYQGGRSIYRMRTLPCPFEFWRRCLSVPILSLLLCVLVGTATVLICALCYRFVTPEGHLPPDPWGVLPLTWLGGASC